MASAVALTSGKMGMDNLLKEVHTELSDSAAPVVYSELRPAAARRLNNTKAVQVRRGGDKESDGNSGREYDKELRDFFSPDVLDPFAAPTRMGRLLALMEDAAPGTGSLWDTAAGRGFWVAKKDGDAVHIKVPMPGLGKEHVEVSVKKNSLVIKGEGERGPGEEDDDDAVPKYSLRIELPADVYKMDKIKAEMKNGVLRVTVAKVKEEERKDVFQIKVE